MGLGLTLLCAVSYLRPSYESVTLRDEESMDSSDVLESMHTLRAPAASEIVIGVERLLLDIANLLATKLDPESLFETIAHVLGRFMKIDRASLAIYDSR